MNYYDQHFSRAKPGLTPQQQAIGWLSKANLATALAIIILSANAMIVAWRFAALERRVQACEARP